MIYHIFDPDTGELKGQRTAQVDPLTSQQEGKTVYLGPGKNETSVEPPAEKAGFARCFIDGKWSHVEDHRGKTIYDKVDRSGMIIEGLGPVPETHTIIAPATAFDKWTGSAWVTDEAEKKQADEEALIAEEMKRLENEERRTAAVANLKAKGLLK